MKPFWLLLAVGSLAAAWRWRSLGRLGRATAGLVGLVLMLFGFSVIELPSVDQIVTEVGGRLGNWTYLLVGVNAFLETGAFLGFIAPGETMVLFGGVLAGAGTIELVPLIMIVWACAVLGDLTSYAIGRRYGRDFLLRHGARVRIGEPQVQFVERFFERHGDLTVLIGRWVGVVRPLVPFLAGSARLPFMRFMAVDVVAAFLWAAGLCILGSVFWRNFDQLTQFVGQALFVLGAIFVVSATVGFGVTARRSIRRNAAIERWIDVQLHERPLVGRPVAALWAVMCRLEPHVPGQRARHQAAAEAATVQDGASADSGSSPDPPAR